MKASILYYSKSGNTKNMAEKIMDGMISEGIETKTFSITDVDEDWIKESSCIIVGTPTYLADVAAELYAFLESMGKYKPAGKIGGAFATEGYIHGGGNIAIQTILNHMMVYGMLPYSGGGTFGKPVIHLGPVALDKHPDEYNELFITYGKRMAIKTKELFHK